MGYYISYEGTVDFHKRDEDKLVNAIRNLNFRHDLKTGGSFPKAPDADPFSNTWFSWLPPRYHEDPEINSVDAILLMLGFQTSSDCGPRYDDGTNIISIEVSYDDKTGAERIFLAELARNGAAIRLEYRGEDGDTGLLQTADGRLVEYYGFTEYSWDTPHDVLDREEESAKRFGEWRAALA